MKSLVITTSLLLFSIVNYAKCAGSGIYSLSDSQLKKGALIVLEFYGFSQGAVKDLNKIYPIYLQNGDEKINLSVVEILKGDFQVTQVVLKLSKPGEVGKQYELKIDKLPIHFDRPVQFDHILKKVTAITYTVIKEADKKDAFSIGKPVEVNSTKEEFGCGPERWVYFNMLYSNSAEPLVRTTVKNKITGNTTTCIVKIENGEIKLGHGMCSGPFLFEDGKSYEVVFSSFGHQKNPSYITAPVSFTAPA